MSLLINNVYSTKEVFLRELISNASDAIFKLIEKKNEFQSKSYPTETTNALKIQIIPDKANRTLTIKDNGIGFTKSDLISFLGTIASSGTKLYQEMLNAKNDKSSSNPFIGQFGLGFYSAFLVAEKIDIITKHPMDEGYIWSSVCESNSYEIKKYDVGDLKHGTSIILTLKEGESKYLESSEIISLVKKHCLGISHPISVFVEKEEKVEKEEEKKDIVEEIDENEATIERPEDKPAEKVRKVVEEQTINNEVPIWSKKLDKIPEEELQRFYKSISNDYDDYLAAQSWHFEGIIDMKVLLFIPKRCRMNFFSQTPAKSCNIKIFNSNVFVTDNVDRETAPEWMDFIVGAVSSSNFPMNISREFLQGNSVMKLLKSKLPKCIAEMLKKLSNDVEKYNSFYKEFSGYIKLGVRYASDSQQEALAKLLRYPTNVDNDNMISLDEYCSKIGESQKQILYITGLSKKEVETSLFLSAFKDRLVLLMHESIDEIMLQAFRTYQGLSLQNITMEGVESLNPLSEEVTNQYSDFVNKLKEILKNNVENVVISNRFSDIPATIVIPKHGCSSTMEALLKSQPNAQENPMLLMMMKSKKIFEINIESPIISELKNIFDKGQDDKVTTYTNFLYNSALVGSGFALEEKSQYIKDLYSILSEAVANSAK